MRQSLSFCTPQHLCYCLCPIAAFKAIYALQLPSGHGISSLLLIHTRTHTVLHVKMCLHCCQRVSQSFLLSRHFRSNHTGPCYTIDYSTPHCGARLNRLHACHPAAHRTGHCQPWEHDSCTCTGTHTSRRAIFQPAAKAATRTNKSQQAAGALMHRLFSKHTARLQGLCASSCHQDAVGSSLVGAPATQQLPSISHNVQLLLYRCTAPSPGPAVLHLRRWEHTQ